MSFLNSLALIGLSLVALPVLIHLLARRRAARLDFPTLRFLRETPSFRLRPRRVREPLLLALRVLALILLILGFARPLITLRSPAPPPRLILIDASLSMRAPGRAAAAREEARLIIGQLSPGERAAVVSFSSEAEVLAAFTSDRAELLRAVERYRPGSGAVDFGKAFAAAAALLEREAPGAAELELISDFQQSNFAGLMEHVTLLPARVRPHAVGAGIERNAFLLDEAVRKNENGALLSASEIISTAEGRGGARRSWPIDESAGERPGISWRTEEGGQLTGRLTTLSPDDFDADDERFFAFTPPRDARVLLIEESAETSLYTSAALEAAASSVDNARPLLTRQRQFPSRASDLNSYALLVLTLHRAPRVDELQLLTEYAEAGGTVWLSLGRDVDTAAMNHLASAADGRALPFKNLTRLSGGPWNIGTADLSSSPLRSLTENSFRALRAVKVREGYALEARDGADTLMRWGNGAAAFVSLRVGSGRILLLGTSTESAASNLGSSPAFPSLAFSILRASAAPLDPPAYELGEAIDLGLSPGTDVAITGNAASLNKAQARDLMQRPLSVFREAGIYRLETEKGVRFVALNTPFAESERALASPAEVVQLLNGVESVAPAGDNQWREAAERDGNTWRYFLGAAFLLLVGEWLIRVRRRETQRAAEIAGTEMS